MKTRWFFFSLPMLMPCLMAGHAQDLKPKLGDIGDGSRSNFVHVIPLLDEEGIQLTPEDDPQLPFSTKQTCAQTCHNYELVTSGWHFNYMNVDVNPGRNGHPWIYADPATGTQIPLSYRDLDGAYHPSEIGMSDWEFIQHFGRHLPGGGVGELQGELKAERVMRAMVSGPLEANCLACHDAETSHDPSKYAEQIAKENFRWAATAASGLADVEGSAKDMPDTYDYIMPEDMPDSKAVPPTVHYESKRFNHKNDVFIDVKRKVPNERCYFCHSMINVHGDVEEKWQAEEDVHIAAGMNCVDCHRNGIHHDIVRGYEGEEEHSSNPMAGALSCEGCHLGEEHAVPTAGKFAAPVPAHKGIPPIHFEKMTCTACHSGPWIGKETQQVKTAMAHALGVQGVNKSPDVLPHIITPVFARNENGKIAPHYALWPSFWGRMNGDQVKIFSLETISRLVQRESDPTTPGNWGISNLDQIASVLQELKKSNEGNPVYISGGLIFKLNHAGKIIGTVQPHPSADPYRWAMGHNVRPAAQSLGINGCRDCHDYNANFFAGHVRIDTPVFMDSTRRDQLPLKDQMMDFQSLDDIQMTAFNASFVWRPYYKFALIVCASVLGIILLAGIVRIFQCMMFDLPQKKSE